MSDELDDLFGTNGGAPSWYEQCTPEQQAWLQAIADRARERGQNASGTKVAAAFKQRFEEDPASVDTVSKTIRKLADLL